LLIYFSLGPSCWLWDYLRRSKQGGFFLPLSGGIDSCSTACIVFSMCLQVFSEISNKSNINNILNSIFKFLKYIKIKDDQVLADLRKIVNDINYYPSSAKDLCSKLFVTCYMATANNSEETKQRAGSLASQIGSTHFSILIDLAVDAIITIWTTTMRVVPRFKVNGGCASENAALQNVI